MISVYKYTDYREFLKDWWVARRAQGRKFSCRNFARVAGFKSYSFISMLIAGDRNLSEDRVPGFVRALGLDQDEAAFFVDLVKFNQAETNSEKNHHYQRMIRCRKFLTAHKLELERFEYFSKWYYVAVREMVALPDFKEDPAWIAARLAPEIEESEAAQALEVLERLKLVSRDSRKRLKQSEKNIGTGDRVQSMHLANFHRTMIRRAADAISNLSSKDRTVSSLTVPMSRKKFEEIRQRICDFRKELRAMLEDCNEEPQEVFQINLHAFSLTGEGNE